MEAFTFLLVALATYRVTRLVTRDRVTLRLRLAIDQRLGHDSTWGYFVRCPWCVGMYVAGATTAAADYETSVPLPAFYWLAVACAVGLLGMLDP